MAKLEDPFAKYNQPALDALAQEQAAPQGDPFAPATSTPAPAPDVPQGDPFAPDTSSPQSPVLRGVDPFQTEQPPQEPAPVPPEQFQRPAFSTNRNAADLQRKFQAWLDTMPNKDELLSDPKRLAQVKKTFADTWSTDLTANMHAPKGDRGLIGRMRYKYRNHMLAALAGYDPAADQAKAAAKAQQINLQNKQAFKKAQREYQGSALGDTATSFTASAISAIGDTADFIGSLAEDSSKLDLTGSAVGQAASGKGDFGALEPAVKDNTPWAAPEDKKNWLQNVGAFFRGAGQGVQNKYLSGYGKNLLNNFNSLIANDKWTDAGAYVAQNPRLLAMLGAQSAGFVVGSGGVAGGTRVLGLKAIGAAAKAMRFKQAVEVGGRIAAAASKTNAATRALNIGAIAGAQAEQAADQVEQTIRQKPLDELKATAAWHSLAAKYRAAHGAEATDEQLRDMVASSQARVARYMGFGAGVASMYLGGLSETGLLGLASRSGRQQLAGQLAGKGLVKSIGTEALSEVIEEGSIAQIQSAAQNGDGVLAPATKLYKGTIGAAATGAALGGIFGGAVHAAGKLGGGSVEATPQGTQGAQRGRQSTPPTLDEMVQDPEKAVQDQDVQTALQASQAAEAARQAEVQPNTPVSANVVLGRLSDPKPYEGSPVPADKGWRPLAWDKEHNIALGEAVDASGKRVVAYFAPDAQGNGQFSSTLDTHAQRLADLAATMENDPDISDAVQAFVETRKKGQEVSAAVAQPDAPGTEVNPDPVVSKEFLEAADAQARADLEETVQAAHDAADITLSTQIDALNFEQASGQLIQGIDTEALAKAVDAADVQSLSAFAPASAPSTFSQALDQTVLTAEPTPDSIDITGELAMRMLKSGGDVSLPGFGKAMPAVTRLTMDPAALPKQSTAPADVFAPGGGAKVQVEQTSDEPAQPPVAVTDRSVEGVDETVLALAEQEILAHNPDTARVKYLVTLTMQAHPQADLQAVTDNAARLMRDGPAMPSVKAAQAHLQQLMKEYGAQADAVVTRESRVPPQPGATVDPVELGKLASRVSSALRHRGVTILPMTPANVSHLQMWTQGRTHFKGMIAMDPGTGRNAIVLNQQYIADIEDAKATILHELDHMGISSVTTAGEYAQLMRDVELMGRKARGEHGKVWKRINQLYKGEPANVIAEEYLVALAEQGLLRKQKGLTDTLRGWFDKNTGVRLEGMEKLEDFVASMRTAAKHSRARSWEEKFTSANAATVLTAKEEKSFKTLAARESVLEATGMERFLDTTSRTGYVRAVASLAKAVMPAKVADQVVQMERATIRMPGKLNDASAWVKVKFWAPIEHELDMLSQQTGMDVRVVEKKANILMHALHAEERNRMYWLEHSKLKTNEAEAKRARILNGIASGAIPRADYHTLLTALVQAEGEQTLDEITAAGMTNKEAQEVIAAAKSGASNNFYAKTEKLRQLIREMADYSYNVMRSTGQYDALAHNIMQARGWKNYVPLVEIDPEKAVTMPLDAYNPSNWSKKSIDRGYTGDESAFQIVHTVKEAARTAAQDMVTQRTMREVKRAVDEWNIALVADPKRARPLGEAKIRARAKYVPGVYKTAPDGSVEYEKPSWSVPGNPGLANRRAYTVRMENGQVFDLILDPKLGDVYAQKLDLSWQKKHKHSLANTAEKFGSRGTRWFSLAQTALNPFWWPMALLRESFQAASNTGLGGDFKTAEGLTVAGDTFVRAMARTINPSTWGIMRRYFMADVVERENIVKEMEAKHPELAGFVDRHKQGDIIHFHDQLRANEVVTGQSSLLRKAGSFIDAVGSILDNIPRQAAYDALVAHGFDKDTASYRSRVLMDFHQRSTAGQTINSIYAFGQAGLTAVDKLATRDLWKGAELGFEWTQGADGIYRPDLAKSWKNLNWGGITAHIMAGAALTYLSAMAMGVDDEDPDGRSWLSKINPGNIIGNVLIPTGNGEPVKVQMGYGLPQVFMGVGSALTLLSFGEHDHADIASGIVNMLWRNTVPIGTGSAFSDAVGSAGGTFRSTVKGAAIDMAPTLLSPVIQHALNQNSFGSRIFNPPYNENGKDAVGYLQARSGTLDHYIQASKYMLDNWGVDVAPEIMQHYASSYIGALRGAQTIYKAFSNAEYRGDNPNLEAIHSTSPLSTIKDSRYAYTREYINTMNKYYRPLLHMYQAAHAADTVEFQGQLGRARKRGEKGPKEAAFLRDHPEFLALDKLDKKMRKGSLRKKLVTAKLNGDTEQYQRLWERNNARWREGALALREVLRSYGLGEAD